MPGLNVKVVVDDGIVLYVRNTRISSIIYGLRDNGPEPMRQVVWLVRYAGAIADCPSDVVCTIESHNWCDSVWVEYRGHAIRYFHDDRPALAFYDTGLQWKRG
jgi:hypothetical protein